MYLALQEKAFGVDLEKRDGGLGLSVSVSTTDVVVFDDRACFLVEIPYWIRKSKTGFCISLINRLIQDHSDLDASKKSKNQRILAHNGSFGSFDAK